MKKFLIPVLLFAMAAVFAGCGTKQAAEPSNSTEQAIEEVQETVVEMPEVSNSETEQTASAQ